MPFVMKLKKEDHQKCVEEDRCPIVTHSRSYAACERGLAGEEFPCENVELLSFVSWEDLGATGDLNDIWGWTDPETKR